MEKTKKYYREKICTHGLIAFLRQYNRLRFAGYRLSYCNRYMPVVLPVDVYECVMLKRIPDEELEHITDYSKVVNEVEDDLKFQEDDEEAWKPTKWWIEKVEQAQKAPEELQPVILEQAGAAALDIGMSIPEKQEPVVKKAGRPARNK